MVIGEILAEDPAQVSLIEQDGVIQALSTNGTDNAVLPRASSENELTVRRPFFAPWNDAVRRWGWSTQEEPGHHATNQPPPNVYRCSGEPGEQAK